MALASINKSQLNVSSGLCKGTGKFGENSFNRVPYGEPILVYGNGYAQSATKKLRGFNLTLSLQSIVSTVYPGFPRGFFYSQKINSLHDLNSGTLDTALQTIW